MQRRVRSDCSGRSDSAPRRVRRGPVASARPTLPRPARLSLRSLASDTNGAALVEITLFMPILVLMAVAIINFGLIFRTQFKWKTRRKPGRNGPSSTRCRAVIRRARPQRRGKTRTIHHCRRFIRLSPSRPTLKCGCVSGSSLTLSTWTTSCATATCGTYVQAVASGTFTPFARYSSFFPSSYSLSSTATARVQ